MQRQPIEDPEQSTACADDHAEVMDRLTRIEGILSRLDGDIRILLGDPPRLKPHWEYGQGVIAERTWDSLARSIGNRVLTFTFGAALALLIAYGVWRFKP